MDCTVWLATAGFTLLAEGDDYYHVLARVAG
jgi:hypothetical protein